MEYPLLAVDKFRCQVGVMARFRAVRAGTPQRKTRGL